VPERAVRRRDDGGQHHAAAPRLRDSSAAGGRAFEAAAVAGLGGRINRSLLLVQEMSV
jgi:hypothetical protein